MKARVQKEGATQSVIREDADDALFRKVPTAAKELGQGGNVEGV